MQQRGDSTALHWMVSLWPPSSDAGRQATGTAAHLGGVGEHRLILVGQQQRPDGTTVVGLRGQDAGSSAKDGLVGDEGGDALGVGTGGEGVRQQAAAERADDSSAACEY